MAGILAAACAGGCASIDVPLELPISMNRAPAGASDEQHILWVLADVEEGIESQRVYKVLAHVSKRYRDAEGRDYEDIQKYVNRLFKTYWDLRITRSRPRVTVRGARARVVEGFETQGRPTDPNDEALYLHGQITVFLEKQGDAWKIIEWGALQ
jgi:hypothetical protein